jgi:hypothetical protein
VLRYSLEITARHNDLEAVLAQQADDPECIKAVLLTLGRGRSSMTESCIVPARDKPDHRRRLTLVQSS